MPDEQTKNAAQTAAGVSGTRLRWRQGLALLALATGLALAGCGDGAGPAAQTPAAPEPTAQEKLAQLEASGQLPQLERLPLLGGMDADSDGVRDDIAEHIRRTYPDPVQYRAAMQVARALQAMLLVDKHDHLALQEVSNRSSRAIACLDQAYPNREDSVVFHRTMETLRSMTTNTKERLQAYLAYNKAMSGSVSFRLEGNHCE